MEYFSNFDLIGAKRINEVLHNETRNEFKKNESWMKELRQWQKLFLDECLVKSFTTPVFVGIP